MVVLSFVLPKVYEIRKDDIDRTFYTVSNNTQATYNQYVDPYVKKLPRASTATSSSAGNSTAEVQRKVEGTMNEATSNVRAGVNQGIDQVMLKQAAQLSPWLDQAACLRDLARRLHKIQEHSEESLCARMCMLQRTT